MIAKSVGIVITQIEKTMTRPQGERQWIQKLKY
jgi:hypothetical protein